MSEITYREIRKAEDVTEEHVTAAIELRSVEYGGAMLTWSEVIDQLERYGRDEDWGSSMESEAIRYLRTEVNRRMRADA